MNKSLACSTAPVPQHPGLALDLQTQPDVLAAIAQAYAALPVGASLEVVSGRAWPQATLNFLLEHGGFGLDADGQYRKQQERRWRLARLQAADQPAVEALFDRVFQQPMPQAFWHWKYAHGRGANIIAWHKDEIVAHYGGLRRAILNRGQPAWAWQIADVMVASRERGVLTRQGAFFLTAAAFAALHINRDPLGPALSFGFPSDRHTTLGERLELYQRVDRIMALRWSSLPHWTGPAPKRLEPAQWPRWAEVVQGLWQQMAKSLPTAIIGVRDAAWIQQRYLEHPQHDYQLYLLSHWLPWRWQALLILRQEGSTLTLVDVVAPLGAVPLAVQAARHLVARQGLQALTAWVSAPFLSHFSGGAVISDPNIPLPVITLNNNLQVQTLTGRWWLLAGDSDYR